MLLLCHFRLCAGQNDILIYDSMYGPIQLSLHENVKFAISQALLHQPTNKEMKSSPSLLIAEITYKSMSYYPAIQYAILPCLRGLAEITYKSMSYYPAIQYVILPYLRGPWLRPIAVAAAKCQQIKVIRGLIDTICFNRTKL